MKKRIVEIVLVIMIALAAFMLTACGGMSESKFYESVDSFIASINDGNLRMDVEAKMYMSSGDEIIEGTISETLIVQDKSKAYMKKITALSEETYIDEFYAEVSDDKVYKIEFSDSKWIGFPCAFDFDSYYEYSLLSGSLLKNVLVVDDINFDDIKYNKDKYHYNISAVELLNKTNLSGLVGTIVGKSNIIKMTAEAFVTFDGYNISRIYASIYTNAIDFSDIFTISFDATFSHTTSVVIPKYTKLY